MAKYIVRSGPHKGQYITLRKRVSTTNKKYAWTPYKKNCISLSYSQARGVVRRYGGEMVAI